MKGKSLGHVRLFVTPWTAAYQAPPSMGFSRQECWSGVPLPSPSTQESPRQFPPSPKPRFWEPLPLTPITPEPEPGGAAQPMMQDVGPPQCWPHRMLQPAAQNAQAMTAPGCLSRKVCTCLQAQCTCVCPCAHADCSPALRPAALYSDWWQ